MAATCPALQHLPLGTQPAWAVLTLGLAVSYGIIALALPSV